MPELTVKIGEKTYPFKKINITIFKEHLEFLKKNARTAIAGGQPDPLDAMDGIIEMTQIIHQCIKRAQPDVTIEELMDGLDQDNIGDVFGQVMQGGSFVPVGEKPPVVA